MNTYKKALRVWITVSSFFGFIAGWIFLSHTVDSETITQIGNTTVEMPALQAIPTLESVNTDSSWSSSIQNFTIVQSQQVFSPPMRTGGS